jgi:GNAT superfamily N-acetyltransferase
MDQSWRVFQGNDPDKLQDCVDRGCCCVAYCGTDMVGQMTGVLRPTLIASIVSAAIGNGQPASDFADALLPPLEDALRARGATAIMQVGSAPWLSDILEARGYQQRETVVTYGWNAVSIPVAGSASITIRPADSSVLDEVAALDRLVFGPGWHKPAEELAQTLQKARSFTVATNNCRIVGYQWNAHADSHGHLTRLAVSPQWQGKGVGTRLFTEALAGMVAAGVSWITLNTQMGNLRSRRLYERYGFEIIGRPVPLMWKDLR